MACFADINVSQGRVATYARCGGSFDIHLTTNSTRNFRENFLKIGSDLIELWPWVCGPTFWPTLYFMFCRVHWPNDGGLSYATQAAKSAAAFKAPATTTTTTSGRRRRGWTLREMMSEQVGRSTSTGYCATCWSTMNRPLCLHSMSPTPCESRWASRSSRSANWSVSSVPHAYCTKRCRFWAVELGFKKTYVFQVFTARCYACAVLAIHGPVSLLVSVCQPQVGVLLKRLNVGSHKQHRTIAQESSFLTPKISAKFDWGHPLRGHQVQVGWVKIGDFWQITSYISKTAKDRHIVCIKVE